MCVRERERKRDREGGRDSKIDPSIHGICEISYDYDALGLVDFIFFTKER